MVSNIIDYIKELNLGTVVYGSTNDANLRLDRKKGPFLIIYLVQDANLDLAMERLIPQWHFNILVADRTPLDATGEVIQNTIDRMYPIAINMLRSLKTTYKMDSKFTMKQSWARYDACVSGVNVEFTITGAPMCLSQFDPEPEPIEQENQ